VTNIIEHLHTLTYDDLEDWAGEKIFTRGKGLVNKVSQLEQHGENELTAKVKGTEWYDCSIQLNDGELESDCTCPYYDRCKHVVAVVLAAAKAINSDQEIPVTKENSELAEEPQDELAAESPNDDEFDAQLEMLESIQQAMSKAGLTLEQVEALTRPNTEQATDYDPDEYLGEMSLDELNHRLSTTFNALTKAKLVQLLMTLAMDHPDTLLYDLLERASVLSREKPASKSQISVLRRQIKKITAEDSWRDNWKGIGHTPDYGPIERGLNQMLEHGQFDEVIELAKEMWPLALEQLHHSHDEGELGYEISRAMVPVFHALPRSSMQPLKQLFWLMDLEFEDEYDILPDTNLVYNNSSYDAAIWREVSTILENRLNKKHLASESSVKTEFYTYRRELGHLLFAFEKQNDMDSMVRVQIEHISQTKAYQRLVEDLITLERREEAMQWLVKGYHSTVKEQPGTANALKGLLCDLLKDDGQYLAVIALIADEFFESPNLDDFKKLKQACEPLGLWLKVRSSLLAFIQSGTLPDPDFDTEQWPLPKPPLTQLNYNANVRKPSSANKMNRFVRKDNNTLMLDIALYEERISDAVAIYQAHPDEIYLSDKFALKVAADHPDAAANYYQKLAEKEISRGHKTAYQEAGKQLRKMRAVLEKHGRLNEWHEHIVKLQTEHKRKIRFMEVLERISVPSKKLID
jgi:uncharacterized Zn finger protein